MADQTAQRIHTYCGLCIARCGAVAVVEDNRFTRLEPDPAHPVHFLTVRGVGYRFVPEP